MTETPIDQKKPAKHVQVELVAIAEMQAETDQTQMMVGQIQTKHVVTEQFERVEIGDTEAQTS